LVPGLHAAYKLAESGMKEVVVLEAQDRIGGRLNTVPINGAFIERGAQWVHGQGKNPLYKFCLEKNVRKTKKHKDKKTERQKDRKTERQKDRKTERQRDRETERQKDRKAERQRGRRTERQKDRKTGNKKTERQKDLVF
jgi:monoamine oxidase